MVNPIPDNVKEVLTGLSAAQQVVIRGYIASLRDEVKDLEGRIAAALDDPDPHAHYHGHEKCTSDHGHGHEHTDECKEEHQDHHHHHEEGAAADHGHHSHSHSHHHSHDDEKEAAADDDMPAWKKKALESGSNDPMAAPFGGTWNTEASISATHPKKEG